MVLFKIMAQKFFHISNQWVTICQSIKMQKQNNALEATPPSIRTHCIFLFWRSLGHIVRNTEKEKTSDPSTSKSSNYIRKTYNHEQKGVLSCSRHPPTRVTRGGPTLAAAPPSLPSPTTSSSEKTTGCATWPTGKATAGPTSHLVAW
jgi:hypothetical protein